MHNGRTRTRNSSEAYIHKIDRYQRHQQKMQNAPANPVLIRTKQFHRVGRHRSVGNGSRVYRQKLRRSEMETKYKRG